MQIIEVDTQEGYNLWSETYDTTGNPLVALEHIALNELLGNIKGQRAVDLGCGTGRNSRKLNDLGAEVVGVDFSKGMLDKAKLNSNGLNINYLQHDLTTHLPFGNNEFDIVLCSLVIEHIADLTFAFKEMKRICKTSGFILISDLHPAMRLKDAQAQFTDHKSGRDMRPVGFSHSMSEYILSIRDSGLQLDEMKEFSGRANMVGEFPKMKKYVDWPMLVIFKLLPGRQ